MKISVQFMPEKLLGINWKRYPHAGHFYYKLYLSIIPMVPIVVYWRRRKPGAWYA